MHDPQAVAALTGAEFIDLTDALSRNDLTELLSWFWGSDAEAFTNGLNWLSMRKQASAARQAARAQAKADAARDEPASPDAAEALIGAIVAGTPVKAADDEAEPKDDRCECGHPARVHNFVDVGTRGFCHECDPGSCKQYQDAGDFASVTP